ncbi:DUF2946 family protein [Massilia forsythiae]|uniref:DUF2946 family protein n=1 Tax=Massilia forsythiae TaxID=2728020 RepID=A0A7Z2VW15_9BURK|nr:DUF2946 family protein [Massilia forsythiae]QJE00436.1 DUF2946 family protein [Massilia forsythiae]
MDDIVKQAMAKWPNVPHCYGWLGLDARGAWRMRDEAAQQADAPGDKLANEALVGFIERNYAADERGCWYFQNGPQRVYVNLESTPFIARTDPAHGLVLHTGAPAGVPERAFLSEAGQWLLGLGARIAQVDDRDAAQLLQALELDGKPASDDAVLAWLGGGPGALALRWQERRIPVEHIGADEAPARFGFVRRPDRLFA